MTEQAKSNLKRIEQFAKENTVWIWRALVFLATIIVPLMLYCLNEVSTLRADLRSLMSAD